MKNIVENIKEHKELLTKINLLSNEIERDIDILSDDNLLKMNYEDLKLVNDFLKHKGCKLKLKLRLEYILENKKLETFPHLNQACYFPELNELDLNKEKIIELDRGLKNGVDIQKFINKSSLSKDIMDFLINNQIITKKYTLSCNCNNDHRCEKISINQKQFEALKEYWKNEDTKNCFVEYDICTEIDCENEGFISIDSLEEFYKHLWDERYILVKKPKVIMD